jgi:TonB family protein
MNCVGCGAQIQSGMRTCTNCGASVADATGASPPPLPPLAVSGGERSDIVYAGFLRRFVALFVDSLVLSVVIVSLAFVVGFRWNFFSGPFEDNIGTGRGLYDLFWLVIAPVYYAGMESSPMQATLGKRALGIKVADDAGRRIHFKQALIRWVSAFLSYLTLYIGFAMAAFTERKRALHDFVAGTVVVDRWAYTAHPERQQRTITGGLIAGVIAAIFVPIFAVAIVLAFQMPRIADEATRRQMEAQVAAQGAGQQQDPTAPQTTDATDGTAAAVASVATEATDAGGGLGSPPKAFDAPATGVPATDASPQGASETVSPPPTLPAEAPASIGEISDVDLLTKARTAQSDNRMYSPAGNNAIEYFLAYRTRHPDDDSTKRALSDLSAYATIATERDFRQGDETGHFEAARIVGLLERVDPNAPALQRLRTMMALPAAVTPASATAEHPADATATVENPTDIGASVDIGFMIHHPPSYSADAVKAIGGGVVVLEVLVDADGTVKQIKVEKSVHSQVLDAAAIAAAKSWHYKQAVHNGKPVDDWVRLPVQFQQ